MTIWTFEQVGTFLDDLADLFPAPLFEELNGGVNLMEQAVPDPEFPGDKDIC